jgi:hypothetical protein
MLRLSGLEVQERQALRKLMQAFEEAKNRRSIALRDRQIIRPIKAGELNAANPCARVRLGNALWSQFSEFFGLSDSHPTPDVPVFWLTLVDHGCVTDLNARDIDAAVFIRRLRTGLRGLSYIGMIDPGLYANIQPGTNVTLKSGVSWHLHLFAWGEDRKGIRARATLMNESGNYRPIIPRPQGTGFHWKQVTADSLARQFRYMCKTPRAAYRVNKVSKPKGEDKTKSSFITGKSKLRPGQRITLYHQLKNHWLDDLLIAGGQGITIRSRAIRCALN